MEQVLLYAPVECSVELSNINIDGGYGHPVIPASLAHVFEVTASQCIYESVCKEFGWPLSMLPILPVMPAHNELIDAYGVLGVSGVF